MVCASDDNTNSSAYDVRDVTLSVYPHRASLKNMPGHRGYTLRVTPQTSYSPEYVTPTQKKKFIFCLYFSGSSSYKDGKLKSL
jgi:hypothetical protein